jgi:hypothetical protein
VETVTVPPEDVQETPTALELSTNELIEAPTVARIVVVVGVQYGVTFPVKVRAVDPPELVAVIVTLYAPPAEGVPDKRPAELRLRPLGRAPPVT